MLSLLLKYHLLHFLRYFKTRRAAKLITVASFLVVFGFVAVGIFLFFREGLWFIGGNIYFKEALNLYLYEMYLLIVFYLVILSTFITAIFALFRDRDQSLLLSSPHFRLLPLSVLVRSILSALWPLFIIVIPALLAMHSVFSLSYAGIVLAIIIVAWLIALVVAKVVIGIIFLGQVLAWLSRKLRTRLLRLEWLVLLIVIVVGMVFYFTWQTAVNVDIIELFRAGDLVADAVDADVIASHFQFLPTHIAAYSIFSLAHSGGAGMGWAIFELLGYSALLVVLWIWFNRCFLNTWQVLQEGNYKAEPADSKPHGFFGRIKFKGGQTRAIFIKEAITTTRNLKNLLWFGFLFTIWLMQAALNNVLSDNIAKHELALDAAPMISQVLQLATAAFFIGAFALRFAYPAFSAERRTAWILASAPVNWHKVFYAKALFYAGLFAIFGLLANYANPNLLSLPTRFIGYSFLIYLSSIVFITIFALALGAIFPNFETDDPASLSTTLPGLGFILGALIYGTWGAAALFRAIESGSAWPIIGFEVITLLLIVLLIRRSTKALDQLDFIKDIV